MALTKRAVKQAGQQRPDPSDQGIQFISRNILPAFLELALAQ